MKYQETQIFLIFFIIGIILGILFDMFRAIRKVFKFSDFSVQMQDLIFILISGIFIINSIIIYNNGKIRLYFFLAISIGLMLYYLSLSKVVFYIFYNITKIFKKIINITIFNNKNKGKKKKM